MLCQLKVICSPNLGATSGAGVPGSRKHCHMGSWSEREEGGGGRERERGSEGGEGGREGRRREEKRGERGRCGLGSSGDRENKKECICKYLVVCCA